MENKVAGLQSGGWLLLQEWILLRGELERILAFPKELKIHG